MSLAERRCANSGWKLLTDKNCTNHFSLSSSIGQGLKLLPVGLWHCQESRNYPTAAFRPGQSTLVEPFHNDGLHFRPVRVGSGRCAMTNIGKSAPLLFLPWENPAICVTTQAWQSFHDPRWLPFLAVLWLAANQSQASERRPGMPHRPPAPDHPAIGSETTLGGAHRACHRCSDRSIAVEAYRAW